MGVDGDKIKNWERDTGKEEEEDREEKIVIRMGLWAFKKNIYI